MTDGLKILYPFGGRGSDSELGLKEAYVALP